MLLLLMALVSSNTLYSQGFIQSIDPEDMSALMNQPCVVKLKSGEEVKGKFKGGSLLNGYLNKVAIVGEDDEKVKFKPEDIERLSVKSSGLAKLAMIMESSSSVKEMTNANYDEIVNREYVIFESGLKASKKDKARLLQLLNPGFDDKIKVYADPEANETGGLGLGAIQLTGGADKSYLFIKAGDKAVKVKKGSYRRNFDELYADCPDMLKVFAGEKIKWADIAGHVFAYNEACK